MTAVAVHIHLHPLQVQINRAAFALKQYFCLLDFVYSLTPVSVQEEIQKNISMESPIRKQFFAEYAGYCASLVFFLSLFSHLASSMGSSNTSTTGETET